MVNLKIKELFDRLDDWRNFPDYQLERRADIFFSLYLKEVLEKHLGIELHDTIIPEFPIKKLENNGSKKVDYVAFSKDLDRVFMIELKTDENSIKESQIEYLVEAKNRGMKELLAGVRKIGDRKDIGKAVKQKYCRLIQALGIVENRYCVNLASILDIIYIIPGSKEIVSELTAKGIKVITFNYFAKVIEEKTEDKLALRFAKSLEIWKDKKAGSTVGAL